MKKLILTALSLTILASTAYADGGWDRIMAMRERQAQQQQAQSQAQQATPAKKADAERNAANEYAGKAIQDNPYSYLKK